MKEDNKKRKKDDDDYSASKYKKGESGQLIPNQKVLKSPSISHIPMSERQQYALLKQMEDDMVNQSPKEQTDGNTSLSFFHPIESISMVPNSSPISTSGSSSSTTADRKSQKRNGAGETLLIQMAKKGDLNAIKAILADGANINEQDYAGWTALHECSIRNYPQITNFLLQNGADVNLSGLQGDTALHDAVKNSCPDVVRQLLKYGADPLKRNEKGIRPIDLAQTEEITKMLFEAINCIRDKRLMKQQFCDSSTTNYLLETISSSAAIKAEQSCIDTGSGSGKLSNNLFDSIKQQQSKSRPSPSSSESDSIEDNTLGNMPGIDKVELNEVKDPYAFEDEEITDSSVYNVTPNKSTVKSTKQQQGFHTYQQQDDANSKDSRFVPSPNQSCESHSNSPKVPPLRIKINNNNNHLGGERTSHFDEYHHSTTNLDEIIDSTSGTTKSLKNNIYVEKPNSSDSESSFLSVDISVNKINSESTKSKSCIQEPSVFVDSMLDCTKEMKGKIKLESLIKDESTSITINSEEQCHPFELDGNKCAKEESSDVIKEDGYGKCLLSSNTGSSKRGIGRTLRSHTVAAALKEKEDNKQDRAPIKKRRLKSRSESSQTAVATTDKNSSSSTTSSEGVASSSIKQQHIECSSIISKVPPLTVDTTLDASSSSNLMLSEDKILMSPNKNETWDNPFRKAMLLNQKLSSLCQNLEAVHPKPPIGFQDYLLTTKQYLLSKCIGPMKTTTIRKRQIPSDLKQLELINLFKDQEEQRYNQALKHQAEREQLKINTELELIRAQTKASRQMAGQDRPYSFCSIISCKNYTYIPESVMKNVEQFKCQKSFINSGGLSSEQFIQYLNSIKTKYEKEKKCILTRQLHESETLMMVQRMDWQLKLKDLLLEDIHGDPCLRRMPTEHVPSIEVPNDFPLFTTEPFQVAVHGTSS